MVAKVEKRYTGRFPYCSANGCHTKQPHPKKRNCAPLITSRDNLKTEYLPCNLYPRSGRQVSDLCRRKWGPIWSISQQTRCRPSTYTCTLYVNKPLCNFCSTSQNTYMHMQLVDSIFLLGDQFNGSSGSSEGFGTRTTSCCLPSACAVCIFPCRSGLKQLDS